MIARSKKDVRKELARQWLAQYEEQFPEPVRDDPTDKRKACGLGEHCDSSDWTHYVNRFHSNLKLPLAVELSDTEARLLWLYFPDALRRNMPQEWPKLTPGELRATPLEMSAL